MDVQVQEQTVEGLKKKLEFNQSMIVLVSDMIEQDRGFVSAQFLRHKRDTLKSEQSILREYLAMAEHKEKGGFLS